MTLMQIREITYCPHHKRGIVVLESVGEHFPLVFYADADEARYLAETLKSGNPPDQPLYEFIQGLLRAFHATATYIVLDAVIGRGILGFICNQGPKTGQSIPCYAPNALALAYQAQIPIYATAKALAHAEPSAPSHNGVDAEDIQQWLAQVKPEDFQYPSADDTP